MDKSELRTVFIGAGNVASSLVPAVANLPEIIPVALASRTLPHSREIISSSGISGMEAVDISAIPTDCDLYLSMLSDDALLDVVADFPANGAIWVHTSGSLPAEILSPLTDDFGVLYPMQTFSKGKKLDMATVPFFVEGANDRVLQWLKRIAGKLSCNVREADSSMRRRMHIAAVFACNFTNHMWAIADRLLRSDGMDITVMRPLVEETLNKAMSDIGPEAGQTGPARRGDHRITDSHISELSGAEKEIYRTLSENIMNHYNNK